MKEMRKRFITMVWLCCLVGVVTLGFVSIVGTGGDDDGGGGSDALPLYNFTIDMTPPEKNGVSAEPQGVVIVEPDKPGPLVVSFSEGDENYELEFYGQVIGTLNTKNDAFTIGFGTYIDMYDQGIDDQDIDEFYTGNLDIEVTEEFAIPSDGPPTSGALRVQREAIIPLEPTETITLTVGIDPEDGPGVTITTDDEGAEPDTVFLTWEELDDLEENPEAPLWQLRGAFGIEVFRFMLEQTTFLTETFGLIDDYEDEGLFVEDGDTVFEDCDAFPEGQNPVAVDQQGSHSLTWYDDSDDGLVGPGDGFEWLFDNCWADDPDDDIDDLYNGAIGLIGYTNVEDGGKITRIGYEPGLGSPGGVYFENFEISEIEEGTPYVLTFSTTLNGGFTIVFYEPED